MDISRDAGGGGDRHRPADETVTKSQLDESGGPGSSKFLFVNVTSDSAAYKHGHRPAVRSHVTTHVAREFKEVHKMARKGKRKVIRANNPTLGPQPYGHDSPKIRHHDSNCPASLAAAVSPISNLTLSIPDNDVLASGTKELHPGQQALPGDRTVIDINPSPFASTGDSLVTDVPDVSEHRKASVSYCKACGRPLGGERYFIQTFQGVDSTKRYSGKKSTTPSPVGILGAGRVDPFSSYPIKSSDKVNELLDHLVTYKIPGLFPDDDKTSGPNSVSIAWLGSSLKTPILFHALLLSSSIHLDIVRWSKFSGNSPTVLSHKLTLLRSLYEIIREGNDSSRDEVILAILTLSSHEVMPIIEEKRNPFNSPLKSLQFLNIYGSIKFVPEHMQAVLDLITLKGGIEKIQLAGLAECLVAGDIIYSINSASKPAFPALQSHETYIAAVRLWATSPSRKPVQKLGSRFWNLQDHGMTDALLQVFDAMASVTIAIDHYLKGKPDCLTVGVIARTRTAIQKRLLLLPPDDELSIIPLSNPCLYEACRVTGLIFGVAVVFPIPNTYDVLTTLLQRLKASIEKFEIYGSKSLKVQYVLLWMLILGGIAALDKVERPWFVSQLVKLVRALKIDWNGVEGILESFLWLESACSQGGQLLWSEVMGLMDPTV